MTREPIHPGETLREDLDPRGMSAAELARRIEVPVNRITEILNGRRAVTGDTALRLGHFFGTSGEFWLNLQKLYELRRAAQKNGAAIARLGSLDDNERLRASGRRPRRHAAAEVGTGGHACTAWGALFAVGALCRWGADHGSRGNPVFRKESNSPMFEFLTISF